MSNKAIVIFGGTGDLTYRKLMPALYNLESLGKLEDNFYIISVGRRTYTTETYSEIIKDWIENYARTGFNIEIFEKLRKRLSYFRMDIANELDYIRLGEYNESLGIKHHYYYFAVAPTFFSVITNSLKQHCHYEESGVIVEKPFGKDLEDAANLNSTLEKYFGKENVYHIDHYLGKEMIQNILTIRFKNAIFDGIWNRDFIDNVQITAHEKVTVGTRAGYYDKSGALKDMVQNHLFQVLSIVAMEEPHDDISQKQLDVLKQMIPITDVSKDLVTAQYRGYLQEENINPESGTETYAAMKIMIDNDRWRGVPFFIRTGKALKEQETNVVIVFKKKEHSDVNMLIIRIQPNEGIYLQFNIKKPGSENEVETVTMDFCQSCIVENRINTPEAYERLLYAAFQRDRSLFSKWEQIVVSWNYMNALIKDYRKQNGQLYFYEKGSLGPDVINNMANWVN